MPPDSRNKNRYACTYDELLSFLKKHGHEVTNKKALDEAAVQTYYEIRTQRQPNDALQALEKAISKKARELIDRTPDSIALPLLLWFSHQYSLSEIKNHGHIERQPAWLNLEYERTENGKIKCVIYFNHTTEDIKTFLHECFNTVPGLFITSTPVLSRAFNKALQNKSPYSSDHRLKDFILHNFPENGICIGQPVTTEDLIKNYLNNYSRQDIPSQKGPLIITLLSASHANPEWQLDYFLEKWHALLKCDTDALGKIGNNKLFKAAKEAFGKPFFTRSDVAMKIDQLTNYEYTDLTIRRKYYRRITYHIEKHLPKNKAEALNRSFTVTEKFSQQVKLRPKLKSEENVRLAIEEALEKFDEVKEMIADSNLSVANRGSPSSISSRLTQATLDQLDVLAQELKGMYGLPARKNRSVALEIAVLFKERADFTRRKDTYPSYIRDNDGYATLISMHEEVAAKSSLGEAATGNQVMEHLHTEEPAATFINNTCQAELDQNHSPAPEPINSATSQENEGEQEAFSAPAEVHTADSDIHAISTDHQATPNTLENPQEEPQEIKVATEVASEEKHPQDPAPSEAHHEPQEDAFSPYSDSQDATPPNPARRPRSDRNDLRSSGWEQIKNTEKLSKKS